MDTQEPAESNGGSIRALGLRSSGKFRAAVLREPGAIARVIRSRRYCLRLRRFSPTLQVSVDTRGLGPADFLSPSLYGVQQQREYERGHQHRGAILTAPPSQLLDLQDHAVLQVAICYSPPPRFAKSRHFR